MAERGTGEWAPLPGDLGREARALAETCRLLKERTGLSLAALAERTHYSKSSWQRCLNGRQTPPRSALRSLAEAAEADPARLLALREAVLRSGRSPLVPAELRRPLDTRRPQPEDTVPAEPSPEDAGTRPRERRDGEEFPEPTAPAASFATTVRRRRLIAAVLLALVLALAAVGTALVVTGQENTGCTTVETDP